MNTKKEIDWREVSKNIIFSVINEEAGNSNCTWEEDDFINRIKEVCKSSGINDKKFFKEVVEIFKEEI
jgi:hypothetical protein